MCSRITKVRAKATDEIAAEQYAWSTASTVERQALV